MKKKNILNCLFGNKALNLLIAMVFGVGTPFLKGQQTSNNSLVTQRNIVTLDSLINPFTFEHIGVSFKVSVNRLGQPKRLEMDEALSVIDRVFEEEGIDLEKNYLYKKDDITVVLNGFDSNLNIGWCSRRIG